MAHVPTEAEINEMSEEELEAYLDGSQPDEARPEPDDASLPAWLRATGAREVEIGRASCRERV